MLEIRGKLLYDIYIYVQEIKSAKKRKNKMVDSSPLDLLITLGSVPLGFIIARTSCLKILVKTIS